MHPNFVFKNQHVHMCFVWMPDVYQVECVHLFDVVKNSRCTWHVLVFSLVMFYT